MNELIEGIDPALRLEFIDDSLDGLSKVSELFVRLEADPANLETVQSIFRIVHSIKGSAAYFGLLSSKALAHEMETLLDLVRKGALAPSHLVVDVLLRGADSLTAMLDRARRQEDEVVDEDAFKYLLEEVNRAAAGEKSDEEALWKTLLQGLDECASTSDIHELVELANTARQLARLIPSGQSAMGEEEDPRELLAKLPEPVRQLWELVSAQGTALGIEQARQAFADVKALTESREAASAADAAVAELPLLADTIGLDDPVARDSLKGHLRVLIQAWGSPAATSAAEKAPSAGSPAAPEKTAPTDQQAKQIGKTMRVAEEVIDVFLEHVGGLVTIGEMYQHLHSRLPSIEANQDAASELRRVNEAFGELSLSLQGSIMNIRKVALSTILQRVPRIVRDIASSEKKQIETRVIGGELLVDKSLVDTLESPLVHMVRNAADHGIEGPDQRKQAGKPLTGTIEVLAAETPDDIVLTVKDDGRGLDNEALARKAADLGLITPGARLSEKDIVNLLFMSGVSTAGKVTDISGRGVGMDVVKRNIENMGGRIRVDSEPGKGCEFTVWLPKTVSTQIITGFIVIVGGNRYIFPMDRIVRCFCPAEHDLTTIMGRGECVKDGGRLLSVCRLGSIFWDRAQSTESASDDILVVAEGKSQCVAIHVDGIEGVRQVVLKNIEGLPTLDGLFMGGAVMGDGAVAMMVDIDRLIDIQENTLGPAVRSAIEPDPSPEESSEYADSFLHPHKKPEGASVATVGVS